MLTRDYITNHIRQTKYPCWALFVVQNYKRIPLYFYNGDGSFATGWKKIGTVKTNKFTYKKAPAGKKMYFRVQAITANGKKGEFSKAVSVKVKK